MSTTIAAISTPAGPGGIGVIRLSGPQAQNIAEKVFRGNLRELEGYRALFGGVYDSAGVKLDECVALNFVAPRSYTGENVVELSCHGGTFLLKRVLASLFAAGAVPAGPGEFTRRAFLNGKLDLAEAEAVMELISAGGEKYRRAAAAAKDGALSRKIADIRTQLLSAGASLAAWADYPDDDVPQVEEGALKEQLCQAKNALDALLNSFDSGRILRRGVDTVIAGKPNAGKSTLMNLLAGCERSIVTDYAGTTRDVVEESVLLGEIPLRLSDTAGIRETADPVEKIGVNRARDRVEAAELVLAVFDASEALSKEDFELIDLLAGRPAIAVINKSDLPTKIDKEYILEKIKYTVYISALQGSGTKELEEAIAQMLGTADFVPEAASLYTERQRDAARRAQEALQEAILALSGGITLDAVTVSTEDAIAALLELTGERATEAVVDSVFQTFCVGK